jgi:hypothetical protein
MVMRQVCQYGAAIFRFAGGIPPAMIVPGNDPAAAGKGAKNGMSTSELAAQHRYKPLRRHPIGSDDSAALPYLAPRAPGEKRRRS